MSALPKQIVGEAKPVSEVEMIAAGVVDAAKEYIDPECNRRFSEVLKYLPSGSEFEQRLIESVTTDIARMLERDHERIRDDVSELRAALMRIDSLEQRLRLLEHPK
jgi:hypothetical protein